MSQILERRSGVVAGRVEKRRQIVVALGNGLHVGETELVGERQQPLLGAVVQIPLQLPPGGVCRPDDARPRIAYRRQARQHLGPEALVLDRETCRRADPILEIGPVEERRIGRDDGDRGAAPRDRRHCPPRSGPGRRRRSALLVHERHRVRQPVMNREDRVSERVGQGPLQASRWRRLRQLARQPVDGAPGASKPEDAPRRAHCERADRTGGDEIERLQGSGVLPLQRVLPDRTGVRDRGDPGDDCRDQHGQVGETPDGARRGERDDGQAQRDLDADGGMTDGAGRPDAGDQKQRIRVAAAPAVRIEKRIAEEHHGQAHPGRDRIHRANRTADDSGPRPSYRRGDEMEDQSQEERRGGGPQCPDQTRSGVPPIPVGGEPDNAGEARKQSDAASPQLRQRESSGGKKPQPGDEIGRVRRGRDAAVRGHGAVGLGDVDDRDRIRDHGRRHDERHPTRGSEPMRHAAIVTASPRWDTVASHISATPILRRATMRRSPHPSTVKRS